MIGPGGRDVRRRSGAAESARYETEFPPIVRANAAGSRLPLFYPLPTPMQTHRRRLALLAVACIVAALSVRKSFAAEAGREEAAAKALEFLSAKIRAEGLSHPSGDNGRCGRLCDRRIGVPGGRKHVD